MLIRKAFQIWLYIYIQEQARRRQRRPRECDAAAQKDQLRISRHGEGGRHVPPHVLSRLFQLVATKLVKRLVTYIYKNMQDSELQVFPLQECVARKVQQSLDTYPGIVFKPRISFPFRSTCNMFCIDRTLQEIQVLQAHRLRAYNSPSPTIGSAIAIINQSSNRSSNQSNNQSINVN